MNYKPGDAAMVWHWTGRSPETLQGTYIGRTETTGEHVFLCSTGAMILGRQVFDTEQQARWWGMGFLESVKLTADFQLKVVAQEADEPWRG